MRLGGVLGPMILAPKVDTEPQLTFAGMLCTAKRPTRGTGYKDMRHLTSDISKGLAQVAADILQVTRCLARAVISVGSKKFAQQLLEALR